MPAPTAAFVAATLLYASQLSGLPIPAGMPAPVVTIAPTRTVGSYADGQPWLGKTDVATGAITLHAGWRESDPDDRCIAAHEFTHLLQFANGYRYEPLTLAEPLAYRTTALCFAAYGRPRRDIAWAWQQVARYGGLGGRRG